MYQSTPIRAAMILYVGSLAFVPILFLHASLCAIRRFAAGGSQIYPSATHHALASVNDLLPVRKFGIPDKWPYAEWMYPLSVLLVSGGRCSSSINMRERRRAHAGPDSSS
jgi:hypothetical protein